MLVSTWMANIFGRKRLASRLPRYLFLQFLDLCLLLLHLVDGGHKELVSGQGRRIQAW